MCVNVLRTEPQRMLLPATMFVSIREKEQLGNQVKAANAIISIHPSKCKVIENTPHAQTGRELEKKKHPKAG